MPLVNKSRVKETTTTTGTGTLSLAGAVAGFQTFISAIGNGNQCLYALIDGNGTGWEMGLGTITSGSPNTLARTAIYESSNSGAAIALSINTHVVFTSPNPAYSCATNFLDQTISRAIEKDTALACYDHGSLSGMATSTLDYENGSVQKANITGGTRTFVFANWPPSGNYGLLNLWITNPGLATINLPDAQYRLSDDTYTSSFQNYITDRGGAGALPINGLVKLQFETIDGGTTVYGRWL